MRPKIIIFLSLFALFCIGAKAQDTKENSDFRLAVKLYEDKLYDLALEQFRQFVSAYPNTRQSIEARFYYGLCQMKLLKYEEARLTFQNFALTYADHPQAPDAWWKVAEACIALENYREAALAFERVKTFHPRSKSAPDALLKAGEYFLKAGDRESARRVLRMLVTEYGSSSVVSPARLRLAEMFIEEGQFEQARIEAKKVAESTADNESRARGYFLASQAQTRLGKNEDAQKSLGEITKSYRTTASYYPALFELGLLHRQAGNFTDAAGAWRTIIDEGSRASDQLRQDALLALGELYAVVDDNTKALPYLERAAGMKGARRGEAANRAGLAAERLGQNEKAASMYGRALQDSCGRLDPRVILIGAIRGSMLVKRYADAANLTADFRERWPRDPALARLLYEAAEMHRTATHDYRKAIDACEQIVEQFPRSPYVDDALLCMAQVLRDAGRYDEALERLRELEQLYPSADGITAAADLRKTITQFDAKSRETGVSNLALLMADVLAEKSKGDLAFRLGEIFFHDLKDYERAAAQYATALASGISAGNAPAALYRRAKSFELLAWKQAGTLSGPHAQEALLAYESLLLAYPVNEFFEDAVFSLFSLQLERAANAADAVACVDTLFKRFPAFAKRESVFLKAATSPQLAQRPDDARALLRRGLDAHTADDRITSELYYHLASAWLASGEKDSAVAAFQQVARRMPGPVTAKALAQLAAQTRDKQRLMTALGALDQLRTVFFYTSVAADIELARAETYYAAGDDRNALASLRAHTAVLESDMFRTRPLSADLYYKLGMASNRLGAVADAKRYFAEFLLRESASPKAQEVYYTLGVIARNENNLELAARFLQESSRLAAASGTVNRASLEAAELFFKSEKYTEAIPRFGEAAQQAGSDTGLALYAQSRIIVCYYRLGNMKEAESRTAAFQKANPGSEYLPEFEYERGTYHMRREEYPAALERFEGILKTSGASPVAPEAIYSMAKTYEYLQNTQRAIEVYDSLLKAYPNHDIAPRAHLALGNVYYSLENWDAAARQYSAILENEQRAPALVPYAMSNLIMAYKELGLYDAALQLTRKYIERFPDDPDLMTKRIDIGVLYQKLGYYDQSVLHLQSLLEGADADLEAEVRYYIGEAYFYKGDYQQAILEFLKIPYLVTKRTKVDWASTSYYMAGQSYEKMSKFEQAITMYRQIIDRPGVDPAFKAAAQKEIDRVNALLKSGAPGTAK